MLLAIDIGNTQTVLGLFSGKRLQYTFRMATPLQKTADEYGIRLQNVLNAWEIPPSRITGVILSSVVPVLIPIVQEMSQRYFSIPLLLVTPSLDTGIAMAYPRPEEVGADRIVNAAAAAHLFGHEGSPLIIIDFGTATTFDLVFQGAYFGGAIAPGLMIASSALSSRTAKLPTVELAVPENVIGHDTVSSMQSGLIFGHVGLVHEIIDRMTQEIPRLFKGIPHLKLKTQNSKLKTQNLKPPKVIATGGFSGLLAPLCKPISIVKPTLTLEGLMIIYQRNSNLKRRMMRTEA